MPVPIPDDEEERLDRLESYDILDSAPEPIYDDLCFLASSICDTEIAAISLIDEERQWFKAREGMDDKETRREDAFCAHAIVEPDETMIVEDALEDPRFRDNPFVTGDPNIRFYAGAPLLTPDGHALGTVCAIDDEPRELTETQRRGLEAISNLVMTQLELRRRSLELREVKDKLEEANTELRRSNEELDRFASVVSHELKDPISQVVSNLDLLEMELADEIEDEQAELLQDAQTGADRMNELVEDLLRYARAGDSDAARQTVDVDELVDQVLQDLGPQIDEADGKVDIEALPQVEGDPALVRQVIRNLVANAVKYRGKEPPIIEIDAEVEDGWARFTVSDNGIGIPEDERARLFQVFERASNTGDREGTGVGLALAARIVDRHGGDIGVESTEGEGSTFWFTLPLAEAGPDDNRRGS